MYVSQKQQKAAFADRLPLAAFLIDRWFSANNPIGLGALAARTGRGQGRARLLRTNRAAAVCGVAGGGPGISGGDPAVQNTIRNTVTNSTCFAASATNL